MEEINKCPYTQIHRYTNTRESDNKGVRIRYIDKSDRYMEI